MAGHVSCFSADVAAKTRGGGARRYPAVSAIGARYSSVRRALSRWVRKSNALPLAGAQHPGQLRQKSCGSSLAETATRASGLVRPWVRVDQYASPTETGQGHMVAGLAGEREVGASSPGREDLVGEQHELGPTADNSQLAAAAWCPRC